MFTTRYAPLLPGSDATLRVHRAAAGRTKTHAATGAAMQMPTEQESALRGLSDPDLMTVWAQARLRLALGTGSKDDYEAVRAEYDRRIGRLARLKWRRAL